jgi:hypothetical protein
MRDGEVILIGQSEIELEREYAAAQRNLRWLNTTAKWAPRIALAISLVEGLNGNKNAIPKILYVGALVSGGAIFIQGEEQDTVTRCEGVVECWPNINLKREAIPDFDYVPRAFLKDDNTPN